MGGSITKLVPNGGEQPVLGMDDLLPGVEDQEVTGAVGVLRLAGIERGLPERRSLLIAEDPRDRYLPQQALVRDDAVRLRRALDLGKHRLRHPEGLQDPVVPLQGLKVHEQGAARVRDIGHMHPAVHPAGEVPDKPAVGVAEQQIAGIRLLACTLDVLEDPDDLGTGEIGRERQPDLRLEPVDAAIGSEAINDRLGAGVLPDDRVVDGLAGVPVPDHSGLPLVRDPDRVDVVAGDVGLGQGLADDLAGVVPDLHRVVLDPAGMGEDLLVLELARRDDGTRTIEDDRTRARRALIDGKNVLRHDAAP